MRDMCYRSSSIPIANFGVYSPEFLSEDEEDHSVYLVDPVETRPESGSTLASVSSSNGILPQFMGVAVGLGILSTLLDSTYGSLG